MGQMFAADVHDHQTVGTDCQAVTDYPWGRDAFAWSLASRADGDKWAGPAVQPHHLKVGTDC